MREAAEGKPVRIGLLQRYATDALIETGRVALCARRADRKARRDRRRGAGRPRLRPRARGRRHRRDDLRGARASRAASTNTASPPTRRSTTSPPARSPSSCRSAASRRSTASRSASTSRSTSSGATTTPCSWPSGCGATNKLGLPGESELENVVDAVDYIAALRQADDLTDAAGRPARRRHRRRHDGDRHRRAVEEARRRRASRSSTAAARTHMKASRYERELAQTQRRRDPHLGAAGGDRGPRGGR